MNLRMLDGYRLLPSQALERLIAVAISGQEIHLCLHRVGTRAPATLTYADTLIAPESLDRLLQLLLGGKRPARVVASFDDGYADAVEYTLSRHSRFPTIDWMFFCCPAKIRDRVGFRWDAAEPSAQMAEPFSVQHENQSKALEGLADAPDSRLATVEELRQVASLPRVALGNHSNCHFPIAELPSSDSKAELSQSRRDFEELFGSSEHFAFPFGVPGKHFTRDHEELLAAEGYRFAYAVEPRPAYPSTANPIRRIPRFAVMGTWPPERYALYVALVTARERIRRQIERMG